VAISSEKNNVLLNDNRTVNAGKRR